MSRQLILTTIWWTWGIVLFLLVIGLSMQPALFGSNVAKVWQWFLPNIVPTLTMVGASAYAATAPTGPNDAARPGFVLAVVSSLVYLLLLTIAVISTLFVAQPVEALQQANLWLGPLQGLAASGLALFFIRK